MPDQLTRNPTSAATRLLEEVEQTLIDALEEERPRWRVIDADGDLVTTLHNFVTIGGKRLRPQFCLWGYLAAGGEPEAARVERIAAALELLHAFALIHDDVMDGSDTRRGAPSVHIEHEAMHQCADGAGEARRYGEGIAVLAGDLAHVLAERLMLDAPRSVRSRWHEMQVELVLGQTLDLVGTAYRRVDMARARQIAVLKSGRYSVVHPLVLGALAADRPELVAGLEAFGEPIGEAFQLRDDLMGAFGSSAATGKPVGDDLREGKPTTLLACAQELTDGADAAILREVGRRGIDDTTVRRVQDVLERCGARAVVERRIDDLAAEAFGALDLLAIDEPAREELGSLARRAVWRAA
jgi:geranylgeranyl diphosphate synthase type I